MSAVGVERVAEYLDTTPTAVYHLRARGKLKGYPIGGRLFFDLREVRKPWSAADERLPANLTLATVRNPLENDRS